LKHAGLVRGKSVCATPCSIHPQGWVPIETQRTQHAAHINTKHSSIHPQGWVPIETLRHPRLRLSLPYRSIHPQGWVPIETYRDSPPTPRRTHRVAFTPKGGCPLKHSLPSRCGARVGGVAFTPKGGCPLKLRENPAIQSVCLQSSIHPQGWVPIETQIDLPDLMEAWDQ